MGKTSHSNPPHIYELAPGMHDDSLMEHAGMEMIEGLDPRSTVGVLRGVGLENDRSPVLVIAQSGILSVLGALRAIGSLSGNEQKMQRDVVLVSLYDNQSGEVASAPLLENVSAGTCVLEYRAQYSSPTSSKVEIILPTSARIPNKVIEHVPITLAAEDIDVIAREGSTPITTNIEYAAQLSIPAALLISHDDDDSTNLHMAAKLSSGQRALATVVRSLAQVAA